MAFEDHEIPMVREAYMEGFAIGLEEAREQIRSSGFEPRWTEWHDVRQNMLSVALEKFGPQWDAIAALMLDTSRDVVPVIWAVVKATSTEELHASLRRIERQPSPAI